MWSIQRTKGLLKVRMKWVQLTASNTEGSERGWHKCQWASRYWQSSMLYSYSFLAGEWRGDRYPVHGHQHGAWGGTCRGGPAGGHSGAQVFIPLAGCGHWGGRRYPGHLCRPLGPLIFSAPHGTKVGGATCPSPFTAYLVIKGDITFLAREINYFSADKCFQERNRGLSELSPLLVFRFSPFYHITGAW